MVSPGLGRENAEPPPKREVGAADEVPAALLFAFDIFAPPKGLAAGVADAAAFPKRLLPVWIAGVEVLLSPNKPAPVAGVLEVLPPPKRLCPPPPAWVGVEFAPPPNRLLVGAVLDAALLPNRPPPVDAGVADA